MVMSSTPPGLPDAYSLGVIYFFCYIQMFLYIHTKIKKFLFLYNLVLFKGLFVYRKLNYMDPW